MQTRQGLSEDLPLILSGVAEVIALEEPGSQVTQQSRDFFRGLLEAGNVFFAIVDGVRVGFIAFQRGSNCPYGPGDDWWEEYLWVSLVWVDGLSLSPSHCSYRLQLQCAARTSEQRLPILWRNMRVPANYQYILISMKTTRPR